MNDRPPRRTLQQFQTKTLSLPYSGLGGAGQQNFSLVYDPSNMWLKLLHRWRWATAPPSSYNSLTKTPIAIAISGSSYVFTPQQTSPYEANYEFPVGPAVQVWPWKDLWGIGFEIAPSEMGPPAGCDYWNGRTTFALSWQNTFSSASLQNDMTTISVDFWLLAYL